MSSPYFTYSQVLFFSGSHATPQSSFMSQKCHTTLESLNAKPCSSGRCGGAVSLPCSSREQRNLNWFLLPHPLSHASLSKCNLYYALWRWYTAVQWIVFGNNWKIIMEESLRKVFGDQSSQINNEYIKLTITTINRWHGSALPAIFLHTPYFHLSIVCFKPSVLY